MGAGQTLAVRALGWGWHLQERAGEDPAAPLPAGKGLQGQPGHRLPAKPRRERLLLVTHCPSTRDLRGGRKALGPGKSSGRWGDFGWQRSRSVERPLKPRKDAIKAGGEEEVVRTRLLSQTPVL